MNKRVGWVCYGLSFVAGGLISLTQPPVQWLGGILLVIAFGLPLVSSWLKTRE